MKTSIVIPVMNDDFIFKCLKTILENFGGKIPLDKEIIIVNDKKSNESFSNKLKEFCEKKKVRYFRAEKPGAAFNRNKGMALAKGDKILFIDSDCKADMSWVEEMEKILCSAEIVEGNITYGSEKNPLFDRVVENKSTPFKFLTANLGIRKEVAKKVKFDERFIVFREDTDFGLSALEKGFKHSFCEKAKVFHRASRFTIKRFIFERKRYIGEPLLFKKHKSNKLLKRHIPRIWRISHPVELVLLALIIISIFFSWKALILAYFLPGVIYSLRGYLLRKRTFKFSDTFLVLFLIPLTMFIKRIYIWKGSIKFRVLLL